MILTTKTVVCDRCQRSENIHPGATGLPNGWEIIAVTGGLVGSANYNLNAQRAVGVEVCHECVASFSAWVGIFKDRAG